MENDLIFINISYVVFILLTYTMTILFSRLIQSYKMQQYFLLYRLYIKRDGFFWLPLIK